MYQKKAVIDVQLVFVHMILEEHHNFFVAYVMCRSDHEMLSVIPFDYCKIELSCLIQKKMAHERRNLD